MSKGERSIGQPAPGRSGPKIFAYPPSNYKVTQLESK